MDKTTIVIVLLVLVAAAFFFIPQLDGKGADLPILGVVQPDLEDVPTNIPCNTDQACVDYAVGQGAPEDVLTKCIDNFCVYTVDLTLPEGTWEVTE